jgi:prephenate dehydratase
MSVAYQGIPGAFGHEACLAFLPDHRPVARNSFAAVVAAVANAETEFGILPLSNNAAGETGARALIDDAPVRITAEHELPVRMHLAARPGTALDQVTAVTSHPVALRQCSGLLAELGLPIREAPNTAVAAAELSGREAALTSETAARLYDLVILRRDVHDRADNATRFAVLARR